MRYEYSEELQNKAIEIAKVLFPHVKLDRIKCYRSYGTSSRGTIARCHALGKLMQKALDVDALYALEFITERFDKLDEEEQIKVIIHELMHIPFTFGGGFKHHDVVTSRNVDIAYREYRKAVNESQRVKEPNSQDLNRFMVVEKPVKKSWFGI